MNKINELKEFAKFFEEEAKSKNENYNREKKNIQGNVEKHFKKMLRKIFVLTLDK